MAVIEVNKKAYSLQKDVRYRFVCENCGKDTGFMAGAIRGEADSNVNCDADIQAGATAWMKKDAQKKLGRKLEKARRCYQSGEKYQIPILGIVEGKLVAYCTCPFCGHTTRREKLKKRVETSLALCVFGAGCLIVFRLLGLDIARDSSGALLLLFGGIGALLFGAVLAVKALFDWRQIRRRADSAASVEIDWQEQSPIHEDLRFYYVPR